MSENRDGDRDDTADGTGNEGFVWVDAPDDSPDGSSPDSGSPLDGGTTPAAPGGADTRGGGDAGGGATPWTRAETDDSPPDSWTDRDAAGQNDDVTIEFDDPGSVNGSDVEWSDDVTIEIGEPDAGDESGAGWSEARNGLGGDGTSNGPAAETNGEPVEENGGVTIEPEDGRANAGEAIAWSDSPDVTDDVVDLDPDDMAWAGLDDEESTDAGAPVEGYWEESVTDAGGGSSPRAVDADRTPLGPGRGKRRTLSRFGAATLVWVLATLVGLAVALGAGYLIVRGPFLGGPLLAPPELMVAVGGFLFGVLLWGMGAIKWVRIRYASRD